MKVFIALDLYDNMVRVAASNELAEKWLTTRAENTWGSRALEHAEWKDAGKDTRDLISDTNRWPYRVIVQEMLVEPTPLVQSLSDALGNSPITAGPIIRGTD